MPRPLFGRGPHRAAAERWLAQVEGGAGSVLSVEGGMGTGRSALLGAVVASACRRGFRVAEAAGSRHETGARLQVACRLLEITSAERDLGAGPQASVPQPSRGPDGTRRGPDATRQTIDEACRRLDDQLSARSAASPMLVVVDDAQWSDADSLRCLAFVARRLTGRRLGVLIGRLSGRLRPEPMLLDELFHEMRGGRRLVLDTLDERAADDFVGWALPGASRDFRARLRWWTGDNPFLLDQVMSALGWKNGEPEPEPHIVPSGVLPWLSGRLGDAMPIARALAVLAGPVPGGADLPDVVPSGGERPAVASLASLARVSVLDAERAVGTLARLGLCPPALAWSSGPSGPLGIPAFRHPVIQAAVLEAVPVAERVRLVLGGARLLGAGGAADGALVSYLLGSRVSDHPAVGALLSAPLGRALRAVPPGERPVILRLVLAHPLPDECRAEALCLLGAVELDQDPELALTRFEDAARLTQDPRRRRAIGFEQARALDALGRAQAAGKVLRDGSPAGLRDPLARRADVLQATLAAQDPTAVGPGPSLRSRLATGQDQSSGQSSDRDLDDEAEEIVAALRGGASGRRMSLERAWRFLRPDDPTGLAVTWAMFLRGRLAADPAVALSPFAVSPPPEGAGPVRAVLTLALSAEVLLAAARVDEAAVAAGEALSRLAALEHPQRLTGVIAALGPLVETCVERGELGPALRLLAEVDLDGDTSMGWHHVVLLCSRGRLRHEAADAEGAVADLLRCGQLLESWGEAVPYRLPWRSRVVPALLDVGDRSAALELARIDLATARGRENRRELGCALGALGQATGGVAGARILAEAVSVLRDPPSLDLIVALGEHGRVLGRTGRVQAGRANLRAACAQAEKAGARRLRERYGNELRDLGGRVRGRTYGPEALTASERRIARLAAAGRTNREIAAQLFVTRRAVEMHLTQVYRKLGITGRGDLGAISLGLP
ncbi:helix-turn-helix transcriptional regulator [Parafrankia sp. FMc2]|uniref:helix-turn-helix transcriptional regulator n=1 Tax=Parafrankia sp. FMc2 TaxID=3233196 RepID=UPI0034D4A4A0